MKIFSFIKKYPFFFWGLVALCLVALVEWKQHHQNTAQQQSVINAQKVLSHLQTKVEHDLNVLQNDSAKNNFHALQLSEKEGVTYLIFKNRKLTSWSGNNVQAEFIDFENVEKHPVKFLHNGWYEIFSQKSGDVLIAGVLKIYSQYAYENQYLVNEFNPVFHLPETAVHDPASPPAYQLGAETGEKLFGIKFIQPQNSSSAFTLSSVFFLLAFLFALLAYYSFAIFLRKKSAWFAVLFSILVVVLRMMLIHLQLPDEIYSTALFSPQSYASSFYFNSLGDLLLNVFLITGIILIFCRKKKNDLENEQKNQSKIFSFSASFLLLMLLYGCSVLLNNLIVSLIINSKISFNTNNIFELNEYSYISFFIISAALISFFLIARKIANRIFSFQLSTRANLILLVATWLTAFIVTEQKNGYTIHYHFSDMVPLLFMMLLLYRNSREGLNDLKAGAITGIVFIFSLYTSQLIFRMGVLREEENRKVLVTKLEARQDYIAEHLFEDIDAKIKDDKEIKEIFRNGKSVQEQITKRLQQLYFSGYWNKFDVRVFCFDSTDHSFNPINIEESLQKFSALIDKASKSNFSPDFFYLSSDNSRLAYLARISIEDAFRENISGTSFLLGTIFVKLDAKFIQSTVGLPELFISSKVPYKKDLSNYSYAIYSNRILEDQFGNYAYQLKPTAFEKNINDYSFVKINGYNHLVHQEKQGTLIVISREKENIFSWLTQFSYLFAFFAIITLIIHVIFRPASNLFSSSIGLKSRIQFTVIGIVVVSFFLIGGGTISYIITKYESNQNNRISDEVNALSLNLENYFSDQLSMHNQVSDEQVAALSNLSNQLSSDFNLYDATGNLFFSSQPKIFDQEIISKKMNTDAFQKMSEENQSKYIHPENIGKLSYTAAYVPFRNRNNEVIGYIQLPYFEKQNELKKEISSFVATLISIYVLLLVLAVLITFLIADRITQPLRLISEKLGTMRLGASNETIEWNSDDEIGALVKQYNQTVEQLAASADKLARSERESAWREMAKQVAHEIKNPLTPMKLSVQHLQRTFGEKREDAEELVQKISRTLIQQIDTLSNIATAFSNFAQMPKANNEKVDLTKILSDTILLFKETPGIELKNIFSDEERFVFADKDQLMRMFSNLFKNSIQSIPDDKMGLLELSINRESKNFIVSISDNGEGIPKNLVSKIFTPNFTTKSAGMGLGLAMVKNIAENAGGKVWFQTVENQGTTFFISIPVFIP